MSKRMTAAQAQKTIGKLEAEANSLRKSGYPDLAAQDERIAARLKRRITSGKYKAPLDAGMATAQ